MVELSIKLKEQPIKELPGLQLTFSHKKNTNSRGFTLQHEKRKEQSFMKHM